MKRSFYHTKKHIMIRIVLLVSLLPSAISVSAAKGTTTVPLQQPLPSLDTCVKLVLKNGQKNQVNTKNSATKVAERGLKNVRNTTTSADALMACTEKSHQIAFAGVFAVPVAYEIAAYLFVLFSSYCIANKDCRDVTQTIYGKVESTVGKMIAVGWIKWSDVGKKTSETLQYFEKLWIAFQSEKFDRSKINAIITAERKKANESISKTSTASTNAGTDVQIPSVSIDDLKRYSISKTSTAHISRRCLTELIINRHSKKYLELFHVSTQKPVPNKDESDTLVVLQIVGELDCKILNYMGKKIEYKERISEDYSGEFKGNNVYSNPEYLTDIKIKKTEDMSMTVYLFLILESNKRTPSITGVLPFKGYIRHAHFRNGVQRALAEIEYMRQNGCFSLQIYPAYEINEKYERCNKQAKHREFEEYHVQFTDDFVKKSRAQKKPFSLKPTPKKK